jgi:hypothetical protein
MYLQRMGRKTFRLRLPVTFALVLLAILLAFAVAGCSFGNGGSEASQKQKAPDGTFKLPNGRSLYMECRGSGSPTTSLKWDKTSLAPIFTKCRRLLPANIGSLLSMVKSRALMVAEVLRYDQTLPRKPGSRPT